jgi:hypothetical protein
MTMIDTPEGIANYRKLQMYYALKLEIGTGLRHSRGSVMNLIRREFNIEARTKKQVLQEFGAMLQAEGLLHSIKETR